MLLNIKGFQKLKAFHAITIKSIWLNYASFNCGSVVITQCYPLRLGLFATFQVVASFESIYFNTLHTVFDESKHYLNTQIFKMASTALRLGIAAAAPYLVTHNAAAILAYRAA